MITAALLKALCPTLNDAQALPWASALDTIPPMYGINKPDIMHEFLANLAEETGEFKRLTENLHYTDPQRIKDTWPTRFINAKDAMPYATTATVDNSQRLANKVYGGRMGNDVVNDGWDYRGAGPMQLTGKSAFIAFTDFYNDRFKTAYTTLQIANLLRTNIELGVHSACWCFAIAFKLIPYAVDDNLSYIVKKLNGGYINMPTRLKYYEKIKQLLPE